MTSHKAKSSELLADFVLSIFAIGLTIAFTLGSTLPFQHASETLATGLPGHPSEVNRAPIYAADDPIPRAESDHPSGSMLTSPPDPSYIGHYWVQANYTGPAAHVQTLQFTMDVPNATPVYADLYYLLMSTFDSATSYDQIGISSDNGVWGFMWSYWPGCFVGNNVSHPDWYTLEENGEYTFVISAPGNGSVGFLLYNGPTTSVLLAQAWAQTGGDYLYESDYVKGCGDVSIFTDYEEVWQTHQQVEPSWNFYFDNNLANGQPIPASDWTPLGVIVDSGSSAPDGNATVVISGYTVQIWNHWFQLTTSLCSPGEGECSVGIPEGSHGQIQTPLTVRPGCSTCGKNDLVFVNVSQIPSGWTWYYSPAWGTPPFSPSVTINVSSSASCKWYPISVMARDQLYNSGSTNGNMENYSFIVDVTCGGGGCVAWGTSILTPAGYVPIQRLGHGDAVEEFNVTSQTFDVGVFLWGNTTVVTKLVNINNGLLFVTPTDQPIYIQNRTFQGWLRDPQNLSTADTLFDPVTMSWVHVTGVSFVYGQYVVFDVITSGLNNFVASGTLLDRKA